MGNAATEEQRYNDSIKQALEPYGDSIISAKITNPVFGNSALALKLKTSAGKERFFVMSLFGSDTDTNNIRLIMGELIETGEVSRETGLKMERELAIPFPHQRLQDPLTLETILK